MFYLGIDVAKAKLDCCLLIQPELLKRRNKTVANTSAGFAELVAWLVRQGAPAAEVHAVMEGTGVYHERAATSLYELGLTISIVNPAHARDFARGLAIQTKTDGIDSLVLARFGFLVRPPAWLPPPPEARHLQALLSRREALAQDLQRERNRQEKAQVTEVPAVVQRSIDEAIRFLEQQLRQLQQDINDHIDRHPGLKADLQLLQSIPAVGPQVGSHLLAVMTTRHFASAEQLAAYLGLVPVERQSGTSLHGRARLSKAGPARIRAVLYMAAVVATRYNPHVHALYERLLRQGKPKMSALGAAMRKLVHLCFGVLKTRRAYQPDYAGT